jgi:hypothetical protein
MTESEIRQLVEYALGNRRRFNFKRFKELTGFDFRMVSARKYCEENDWFEEVPSPGWTVGIDRTLSLKLTWEKGPCKVDPKGTHRIRYGEGHCRKCWTKFDPPAEPPITEDDPAFQ